MLWRVMKDPPRYSVARVIAHKDVKSAYPRSESSRLFRYVELGIELIFC